MKPSSVVLNVNVNLKMTLLQVYATLQGSHDLHSCLTSSNAASWQAQALQIWVESSPPHHTASPSTAAFILHAVQGPASLHSLHVKPPCLWKAFHMRGGEAGGVAGNGWGWAVQRWALGAAGLSRRGAWPSSGLEEQLCWLRLDSDGEGSRAALAAAGVDRRTHLSFSLIFLRLEGKRKDKWHQALMGSELLTAGQALGKGSPSSPLGSTRPGHRKCCRSGVSW